MTPGPQMRKFVYFFEAYRMPNMRSMNHFTVTTLLSGLLAGMPVFAQQRGEPAASVFYEFAAGWSQWDSRTATVPLRIPTESGLIGGQA